MEFRKAGLAVGTALKTTKNIMEEVKIMRTTEPLPLKDFILDADHAAVNPFARLDLLGPSAGVGVHDGSGDNDQDRLDPELQADAGDGHARRRQAVCNAPCPAQVRGVGWVAG